MHIHVLYEKYKHWLKGENLEQAKLVNWLEENNYKFTSIPNSTYTKSFKQKMVNTLTWLRPWLCDILIILKRGSLLFIELKKKKWKRWGMNWSTISDEQLDWIDKLQNIDNIEACICHWHEESIEKIVSCEKM